jgi:hypothetical protein
VHDQADRVRARNEIAGRQERAIGLCRDDQPRVRPDAIRIRLDLP